MAFSVDVEDLTDVHVRVFLSRSQAGVSQEFLDRPKVRSPAEEMGGERMAEGSGGLIFLRMAVFFRVLSTIRSTDREVILPPR